MSVTDDLPLNFTHKELFGGFTFGDGSQIIFMHLFPVGPVDFIKGFSHHASKRLMNGGKGRNGDFENAVEVFGLYCAEGHVDLMSGQAKKLWRIKTRLTANPRCLFISLLSFSYDKNRTAIHLPVQTIQ